MKKSIKITLSSVLFALTVNNFSYAVSEAPKNSDIKIIEANIGKKAPEINIESLFNSNKKSLKLADLRGKIVILEFWATWCEPCIEAVPHIEKMQKEFKNDLLVIAITDEKRDVIEKYLKTHPTNLIIGIDSKEKIILVIQKKVFLIPF